MLTGFRCFSLTEINVGQLAHSFKTFCSLDAVVAHFIDCVSEHRGKNGVLLAPGLVLCEGP